MKRCAVITGAAGGIGLATARRFGSLGMNVCMIDRDAERLATAASELSVSAGRILTIPADVTKRSDIENAVAQTTDQFGRIDALANIAGGAGTRNLHQIDEIEDDDWDLVLNLNLRSTFMFCRAVVPIMREQRYGRIINMSSTIARGKHGPVGTAGARLAYAAAKSGIIGLTAQLAKDVGEFNITVNAVMPWLTFGEQGSRIRAKFDALAPELQERTLKLSPMHRAAEASDVAATIAFLASEEAGYVSGTALPVDGAFL